MVDPGSFLIIGFQDISINRDLNNFIQESNLFGIVLFAHNFHSQDQLQELCSGLQSIKSKVSNDPLLIAVDYEGGFVTRFDDAVSWIPSAMAQAKGGRPEWTRQLYHHVGLQLKHLGINCNLAPSLDVAPQEGGSAIGIRSFSSDPQVVTVFARAAYLGIQDAGLFACGKHFPGLGHVTPDTHQELPEMEGNTAWFQKHAWPPFKSLIQEELPMVMTAHALVPSLAGDMRPVPLSHEMNQNVLRKELGFQGLILTDDFSMGAAKNYGALEDAVLESLSAGSDAVMLCHDFNACGPLAKSIGQAIQNATLDTVQLEQSHQRKMNLFKKKNSARPAPGLSEDEASVIKRCISSTCLTPIKLHTTGSAHATPTVLLAPEHWSHTFIEQKTSLTRIFCDRYEQVFGSLQWIPLESTRERNTIPEQVQNAGRILLLSKDLLNLPPWLDHFAALNPQNEPIDLFLCSQNISDHPIFALCKTVLCTFGFHQESLDGIFDFMRDQLQWS